MRHARTAQSGRNDPVRSSRPETRHTFKISAKTLGALALPDFCPRCFWLSEHHDLPFQMGFPGIFSSIDSFTKKVVHAHFDRRHAAPPYLAPLGKLAGYVDPPHYSKYQLADPATGITLTASPDGVFKRPNGRTIIVDYKTARFSGTQDSLFPIYNVQLNVYALIGESQGLSPVTGLTLIYFEPLNDDATVRSDGIETPGGFRLPFAAKLLDVPVEPGIIPPLREKAAEILASADPPDGRADCEDCRLFAALPRPPAARRAAKRQRSPVGGRRSAPLTSIPPPESSWPRRPSSGRPKSPAQLGRDQSSPQVGHS